MKIYFSPKVSLVGLLLIAGMLRASYWQWGRHLEKTAYIEQMAERLKREPAPLESLLAESGISGADLPYRRVEIEGEYDFAHEMVLRNRRLDEEAGVHVLTPLKLKDSSRTVLVDRGFLPIQYAAARGDFQRPSSARFVGLIKESTSRRLFAPSDPPAGPGKPWVDAWLRVDLPAMGQQLPYPLEPFYLEIMSTTDPEKAQEKIVTSSAGREELLVMGMTQLGEHTRTSRALYDYPVPAFDTVIPPGRHYGYVFEWAVMAVVTLLICVIVQLRPRRQPVVS